MVLSFTPLLLEYCPNFDATITPHYMERRGLQWQNEFRYLLAPGSGTMALDWLPNDRIYTGPDGTDKMPPAGYTTGAIPV